MRRVDELIQCFADSLLTRAMDHDASKLESPELEVFAEHNPKLRGLVYGSQEYTDCLKAMQVALDHHYAQYRHHPQHHEHGVDDMDLIDLVEALCDWRAAVERHETGCIFKSIEHNTERFGLSPQLARILTNTARRMEEEQW